MEGGTRGTRLQGKKSIKFNRHESKPSLLGSLVSCRHKSYSCSSREGTRAATKLCPAGQSPWTAHLASPLLRHWWGCWSGREGPSSGSLSLRSELVQSPFFLRKKNTATPFLSNTGQAAFMSAIDRRGFQQHLCYWKT